MQQPRDLKKKKTPQKSHVWFTFSRLPPSVHFCGNTWTEVHAVVSDQNRPVKHIQWCYRRNKNSLKKSPVKLVSIHPVEAAASLEGTLIPAH